MPGVFRLFKQSNKKGDADLPAVAKAYRDGRQETLQQSRQKQSMKSSEVCTSLNKIKKLVKKKGEAENPATE